MSQALLRGAVETAIAAVDPAGLLGLGCPSDEYEPEVDRIVEGLGAVPPGDVDAIAGLVQEVMVACLGPIGSGTPAAFRQVAELIVQISTGESREVRVLMSGLQIQEWPISQMLQRHGFGETWSCVSPRIRLAAMGS